MTVKIPFVDLKFQHQPIQSQLHQAIETVLTNGDFILGEAVSDFETAFAHASGTEYGIGVASGTDAITLGLEACNIGQGDEVILPMYPGLNHHQITEVVSAIRLLFDS